VKTKYMASIGIPTGLVAALLILVGCESDVEPLQPKLQDITRGAAQINVYGKWDQKLYTLGRGQYTMIYQLQFAPAGTEIRVRKKSGAITSGTLFPLTSPMISTTFSLTTNKAIISNPAKTTDAKGQAKVSIRAAGGPAGLETLKIKIDYKSPKTGAKDLFNLTDEDEFEVSIKGQTAWE